MKLPFLATWIIFLFVGIYTSAAQDTILSGAEKLHYDTEEELSPVPFDRERIESYKDEKAFDYLAKIENESWWTRFKNYLNLRFEQLVEWLFGDYKANTVVAFLLNVLPYLILSVVIGFIIWLFIRLNPGASVLEEQGKAEVFFNEEEKIVRSRDISELIETAINKGEYRLAVRYYYLQLLKQLNDADLIEYEYQKTNADYLSEIKDGKIKAPLQKIMRLYDYIWYGNFPVTSEDFLRAQKSFRNLRASFIPAGNE